MTSEEAKARREERKQKTIKWAQEGNIIEKARALIADVESGKTSMPTSDKSTEEIDKELFTFLFDTTEEQAAEIKELKSTITQQAKTIKQLQQKLVAIQQIAAEAKTAEVEAEA